MWKKIVAGLLVLVVIAVAAFRIFFGGNEIDDLLSKQNETLTSYELKGTMEMSSGEEVRNYNVEVSYKKDGEEDLFKVSLLDTNINQLQLIVRNTDGVFVLTPSLNQVYSFKGEWPLNSPKPYLYQCMLNCLKGEHELKTLDDGYLVTCYPEFKNSNHYYKQEVKFDKELNPKFVYIYDKNDVVRVKFNVVSFERNVTFEDNYFNQDKILEDSRTTIVEITTKNEDLPLYPVNVDLEASLRDQTVANIQGEEVHILAYEGEKSFTVVQRLLSNNDEAVFSDIEGEMIDLMNGVGFLDNNQITCVYNGVEYKIYSDVLNVAELIEVANGMEVVVTKE